MYIGEVTWPRVSLLNGKALDIYVQELLLSIEVILIE